MPDPIDDLRWIAFQCRQLAASITDTLMLARLLALAVEYEVKARGLAASRSIEPLGGGDLS